MNINFHTRFTGCQARRRGGLPRRALEALLLQEYRRGRLSNKELRTMLGMETRHELDGFLKAKRGTIGLIDGHVGRGGRCWAAEISRPDR